MTAYPLKRETIGFVSWYGATGSCIEKGEHFSTGATLRHLRTVGLQLPDSCQFHPLDLAEYFKPGEDVPCVMRGSIHALSLKKYWGEHVLERLIKKWLSKSKITCLNNEAWQGIVYKGFWRPRVERLAKRYGRCSFSPILNIVNERWNMDGSGRVHGGYVLVDGQRVLVDNERLAALKDMHTLERKLRTAV